MAAMAASPENEGSIYSPVRYNDDFRALCDPAKQTGFWDPLKCIRLGDALPDGYLTFGGELRERFESYNHPNFGFNAPAQNAYVLQRLMPSADVHFNENFRIFTQLVSAYRFERRDVSSTTDVDRLDLLQGFADLRVPAPLSPLTLRVGRQELLFGFQRLVAVREGPNVLRSFDGIRVLDKLGEADVSLIAVRPVTNKVGAFDDASNLNQALWGSYVTVPVWGGLKADLYWLGYENARATIRGKVGPERRQSVGTRLFGSADGFDWNAEAVAQGGSFGNQDISAWMFAGIAGYTFRTLAWEPRIGLESTMASGDDPRKPKIGTFNPLYPRLPYFAETSLLVPANVTNIRPVVSFKPLPDVTAVLGYDTLWRTSTHDYLYGSGMVPYPRTNRPDAKFVGHEPSVDVRWRPDEHLTIAAIYATFLAGPAVTNAGGKTVDYFAMFATYKF
jgi:hypothetical protein